MTSKSAIQPKIIAKSLTIFKELPLNIEKDPRKWHYVSFKETKSIPCVAGCYALIGPDKEILYIGRSKALQNRLARPSKHSGFLRTKISHEQLIITWNTKLYDYEKQLIKMYNPPLSLAHYT
jgi:hypothetical protein